MFNIVIFGKPGSGKGTQADFLKDKLPDSPYHPKGRNPYAHILVLIKKKFGCSYKDIDDENYEILIKFIEFLKKNYS